MKKHKFETRQELINCAKACGNEVSYLAWENDASKDEYPINGYQGEGLYKKLDNNEVELIFNPKTDNHFEHDGTIYYVESNA